jgi:hypothetical protein
VSVSVDQIAKVAHEANRAYCEGIGDNSQLRWEDAPDWQRESAINGVKLHLASDLPPSSSHDAWLAEKKATGWKYGPVKSAEDKEHPCIVSFDELPMAQKVKDYLFSSIVRAFKAAEQAEQWEHGQ